MQKNEKEKTNLICSNDGHALDAVQEVENALWSVLDRSSAQKGKYLVIIWNGNKDLPWFHLTRDFNDIRREVRRRNRCTDLRHLPTESKPQKENIRGYIKRIVNGDDVIRDLRATVHGEAWRTLPMLLHKILLLRATMSSRIFPTQGCQGSHRAVRTGRSSSLIKGWKIRRWSVEVACLERLQSIMNLEINTRTINILDQQWVVERVGGRASA